MFDMKVKTLLAVIESGSYTKAAQKLNLTQPAVSHQIRLLENEFDIKIFYRSKNKLKLTPQGKILVQRPSIPMPVRPLRTARRRPAT